MGKKLIILIVACLMFVGCAAIRSTQHTRIEDTRQELNEHLSIANKTLDWRSVVDSICTVSNFVFYVYDTDKPPDTTGNYPLMMRGEINTQTQRAAISTETRVDSIVIADSINNATETKSFETTKKINKIGTPIANMLCFAIIFCSVAFAYITYKRR